MRKLKTTRLKKIHLCLMTIYQIGRIRTTDESYIYCQLVKIRRRGEGGGGIELTCFGNNLL